MHHGNLVFFETTEGEMVKVKWVKQHAALMKHDWLQKKKRIESMSEDFFFRFERMI